MSERDELDLDFERFCRTHDLQALGRVFDRAAPQLLRIALWLCGHRADAEDAVQRAFVQAIDARARFDARRGAMPWLIGLLTHQVGKIRRERLRRPSSVPSPGVADPLVLAATQELQSALEGAVARLGPAYHDVLRLHLQDGLDAHDIAARLQRPRGTVRTQLMRGLQALRERLPRGFLAGTVPGWLPEGGSGPGDEVRHRVLAHARAQSAPPAVSSLPVRSWLVVGCLLGAVTIAAFLTRSTDATKPLVASPPANQPEPRSVDFHRTAREASAPTAPPRQDAAPARWGTLVVDLVWDDDGTPAAGQAVLGHTTGHPLRQLHLGTDAAGRCVLEGIEPGTVVLQNDAKYPSVAVGAGATAHVTLRRSRGLQLRGRVVDENGKAVAAASLIGQCDAMSRLPVVVACSGSDGAFTTFVPPGTHVHARHRLFAPSQARSFDGEPGESHSAEFVMRGVGATLHGQVCDAHGQPVPFALVAAQAPNQASSRPRGAWHDPPPLLGRADAGGHYRLEGLPACVCRVQAWGIGHAPWTGEVALAPGGERRFDPVLAAGATISGSVRDGDHRPIRCRVRVEEDGGMLGNGVAASDAQGVFRIDSLAAGPTPVVAADLSAGRATATLSLRNGETTTWDARLDRGRVAQGVVLDLHGHPLVKATVGWQYPGGERERWTHTDETGAFALIGLPDSPIEVCVFGTGWTVLATTGAVHAPADALVLRVLEPPTASLRGRVVDASGRPLRATLLLGRASVATRKDGSFEVGALPSGRYDVLLYFEGPDWLAWQVAHLAPGEAKDLGDYVLHPPHTLLVHCTNADGTPTGTGSALVHPDVPGGSGGHAAIRDGVARIEGLQPRRYRVNVMGNRQRGTTTVDMMPGRTHEVAVQLGPVVLCKVSCTSPHALPARAMAGIEAIDAADVAHRGEAPITDEPYASENLLLRPGRYTVRARYGDTLAGEVVVDVAEPWFGEKVCRIVVPLKAAGGR